MDALRGNARRRDPSPRVLGLERLEDRNCPSGDITGPPGGPPPPACNLSLMFSVFYGAGRQVTFTGAVMGGAAGAKTVVFTGTAGATVQTDASGMFQTTTTATAL